MIQLEFRDDLLPQKTSPSVVCLILHLAVLVQCRLVTDRQMDGRTDTRRQHISRKHSVAW